MITEALTALADQLTSISGLRPVDHAAEQVNPPAAMLYLGDGTYDEDMNDAVIFTVTVVVLVSQSPGLERAQAQFQQYLDPTGTASIAAAVHADPTLGGTVNTTRVVGWSEPKTFGVGGVDYAGVEIDVEIISE